jgi:predicted dehydrogenase
VLKTPDQGTGPIPPLMGAIVGFGDVARHGHWPAYSTSEAVSIVAVVDPSPERRALAAGLSPSIATFETVEGLSASAPIDFVDICTPPALHAAPLIYALDSGWHVLCEKPLLLDAAVFDIARSKAAAAGRSIIPVHNWKYAPIVRAATDALREGAIGPLRRVEIETQRRRDCAAADPARPNWRRNATVAGGGILMDHGWHSAYLALQWFAEQPVDVSARLHWPTDGGVEDEAEVRVLFPSGEAAIRLSWNAETRRNTIRLVGEGGLIDLADDTLHVRGRNSRSMRFSRALSSGSHHEDWFAAMLPDILSAFRNQAQARAAFEEAAASFSILKRAYHSATSA